MPDQGRAGDDVTADDLCARCKQPLPGDEPCFEMSDGTFTHIVCTWPPASDG